MDVGEKRTSMRLCDLDKIKVCVDRQYENCHGYTGSKKAIYREAILAVKSILHSAKPIDAVEVVRCRECYHKTHDGSGRPYCWRLQMYLNKELDFFCKYGKRKEGTDNG